MLNLYKVIHKDFKSFNKDLEDFVFSFESTGEYYQNSRNKLKLFNLSNLTINVKAFRVPNIFNQIAYKFFRKSKAQRSYEYANKLIDMGIGTPQPIAYYEFTTPFLFKKSYFISEHLKCDLTYRELTTNFDYPDYETILRAFTRFTFELHQKNIHFFDHSPGNTLIKKNKDYYDFYLVDLNRMKFKPMDFKTRIKNFSRLTIHKSMVEIMSDEYAKLCNEDYNKVFDLMWSYTEKFQRKYHRKKRLKKKLEFWKV